ncbi:MAG: hypothetical protein EBY22_16710, partial [Gammaproteobacteria bacterium]|nr:hypothetical protein [Gammaproteobacteria bacterium]
MKRIFTFLSLVILGGNAANAQSNISDARQMGIGQTVTVHGVVTNGSELGSIRYIQDATGAIPAYGSTLSSVQRGDTITATGALFDFSGLLEISPTSSFTNHGNAVVNPTPLVIPISSASEALEAQLVRIDNVTFVTTGTYGATGSNTTVQVTDGTNTFDVRINSTTNIDGTNIPTGAVSIVGLMGQFNANYLAKYASIQDDSHPDFVKVAELVTPTVVHIITTINPSQGQEQGADPFGG